MIADWWRARELRERRILTAGAVIAAALIAWQGVAAPLLAFHARGEAARADALETLRYVENGLAAYGRTTMTAAPVQPATTGDSVLAFSNRLADEMGLTVARVQRAENGAPTLWIDEAPAPRLYDWIAELERRHGVVAVEAIVRANQDGATVRAQVSLRIKGAA